jgi:hypothetical protein
MESDADVVGRGRHWRERCDAALPADHRGQTRPQGGGSALGAVERTP